MKRKSLLAHFLDGFTSVFTGIYFGQGRSYVSPVRAGPARLRDSVNLAGDWQKVGDHMRTAIKKGRDLKLY